MFKKSLLITLVLACLLPWGKVMAQTPIVYENDFNASSSYPDGWTKVSGTSQIYSGQGMGTPASNAFRFGTYSSSTDVVALPSFSLQINTLQISFYHKAASSTTAGTFEIGYLTDLSDASTFISLSSYTASNSTAQYSETATTISLASAPNDAYIAYKYTHSSMGYWYIDNIIVETLTSECEAITLPYSNGFETGDDDLSCWKVRNGATNTGIYQEFTR